MKGNESHVENKDYAQYNKPINANDFNIIAENGKDRLSRILGKRRWQLLFIILVVFIVLRPVLTKDQIFMQTDSLNWSYPDLSFYQDAIRGNNGIWWNPYIFSGFPTYLSVTGGYLSPIFYLFLLLFDYLSVFHWLIFFNLILGGYLTVRLLINFKIGFVAALIGGFAYLLSSRILITDLPVINYFPYFPAVCLILIYCYKKNGWLPVFLGSLVIYLAWVTVHYNWLLLIFANGFIFSIFYPWIMGERSYKKYLNLFFNFLLIMVGGSLLASPLIFSLIKYLPYSYRAIGYGYQEASASAIQLFDFANFFLPFFNMPFWFSGAQLYIGILPIFFIVFSLILYNKNRVVRYFASFFIICLLVAVSYSPFFWLMQKLPILNFFRGSVRWMFLGSFAGSILAGFGAESFLNDNFGKYRKKLIKIFKYLFLLIVIMALASNILDYFLREEILNQTINYFDNNLYQRTTGLPLEHYHSVIKNKYLDIVNIFSFSNAQFFYPFIIILISYLELFIFTTYKKYKEYFLFSALLVISVNFILIAPLSFQLIPKKIFNYNPKIARYISDNPGKVFSFLPGFSEYNKLSTAHKSSPRNGFIFQTEMLAPNTSGFYKIKSADGFNSLMPKRHVDIISLLGSDRVVGGEKLSELRIPLPEKINLFKEHLNLIDLLGVKYIISAYPMEDKQLNNVLTVEITDYKIPLYLYRNENNLPEVYFASNIVFLEPNKDSENLEKIKDKRNNFKEKTFIECIDCQKAAGPLDSSIQVIVEKNGYLKIQTANKNDGWLVFSQSNLPGWSAKIDGTKTDIYYANYLFQGIYLEEGSHDVIFEYKPF